MTRILIVEDEVSFSDPLSYLLSKEGYDVTVAENGHDALTAFDGAGADLVLLDLMLPGLSGVDVCRALRQRSNVPVIMLTAKDSEIDKVVGLELGADDYVTKPYSCLLYTSDAADERSSVDLGGRRIIKKKKTDQCSHARRE